MMSIMPQILSQIKPSQAAGRAAVIAFLAEWQSKIEFAAVPDLTQRQVDLAQEIQALAGNFDVELSVSGLVPKLSSKDQATLAKLTRGTTWFEGNSKMPGLLTAAYLSAS